MAELPSGTVTFVFTDIEGSTRMLHELRERYGDVLAGHARILRAAFEGHGGREIDTQGDSFFAAFRTAKDALAAAVEAQRNLAAEPFFEGARPAVRMGVHTGEPSVADERYVGLAVHRAARICSAAHGGQILLSGTTRDLVADELPPGASLRDLGEHKLKDFERPERVFQVVVEGLLADFPPLATEREAFRGREGALVEAAEAAIAEPAARRRPIPPRALWAAGLVVLVAAVTVIAVVAATGGAREPEASGLVPPKSVALIDPARNVVSDSIPLDGSPSLLAGDGRDLWITNTADKTLLRIDAETRKLVQTIGLGATPNGIATGAGAVWITSDGFGSSPLLEVTPATNDVRDAPRPQCCSGLWFITGDDERLWIASYTNANIVSFDPQRRQFGSAVCCGVVADAIALGESALWVVEREDEQVVRMNPDTGSIETTIPIGAPRLQGLTFRRPEVQSAVAAGESGVWVVDAVEGLVWQIDPVQNRVKQTISVGAGAKAVAIGFGSVWVANGLTGTVSRIDPSSGHVIKRIKVAARLAGIATSGGAVWVGVP